MEKEEQCLWRKEDGIMYDMEYAKTITIRDDCWLAMNVVVCGGASSFFVILRKNAQDDI